MHFSLFLILFCYLSLNGGVSFLVATQRSSYRSTRPGTPPPLKLRMWEYVGMKARVKLRKQRDAKRRSLCISQRGVEDRRCDCRIDSRSICGNKIRQWALPSGAAKMGQRCVESAANPPTWRHKTCQDGAQWRQHSHNICQDVPAEMEQKGPNGCVQPPDVRVEDFALQFRVLSFFLVFLHYRSNMRPEVKMGRMWPKMAPNTLQNVPFERSPMCPAQRPPQHLPRSAGPHGRLPQIPRYFRVQKGRLPSNPHFVRHQLSLKRLDFVRMADYGMVESMVK